MLQHVAFSEVGAAAGGDVAWGVADEPRVQPVGEEDDAADFSEFLLVGFDGALVVGLYLYDFPRLVGLAVAAEEGVGDEGLSHVVAVFEERVDLVAQLVEHLHFLLVAVGLLLEVQVVHVLVVQVEDAPDDVGVLAALVAVADHRHQILVDVA